MKRIKCTEASKTHTGPSGRRGQHLENPAPRPLGSEDNAMPGTHSFVGRGVAVCFFFYLLLCLWLMFQIQAGQLGDVITGLSYMSINGKMNGLGGARIVNNSGVQGKMKERKASEINLLGLRGQPS